MAVKGNTFGVQGNLTNITAGLTSMFKDIVATAEIPDESKMKLIVFSIQTILQAAGASNVCPQIFRPPENR